jgi:hypothetical protein
MRLALICAAAMLASSSLAQAADTAENAAVAATAKGDAAQKTRKVCRREMPTGSTIPKRVCRTVPVASQTTKPAGEQQVAASGENGSANR